MDICSRIYKYLLHLFHTQTEVKHSLFFGTVKHKSDGRTSFNPCPQKTLSCSSKRLTALPT
jgi:hypothetical protein